MNPESNSSLTKVTPLSKALAAILFIALPFLGLYIGYTFAPEKVVEVDQAVGKEVFQPLDSFYGTMINQGSYAVRFNQNGISYRVASSNDWIDLENEADLTYIDSEIFVINDVDINYDGYKDVAFLYQQGPASNNFYQFFVFNSALEKLESQDFLFEGEPMVSSSFNSTERSVTTYFVGPPSTRTNVRTKYLYQNGEYVISSSVEEKW
ncbi:MAG: hypothetical protein ACI9SY_000692 [Candidatus Paceibacteria bacterium]|jgi:hypothetical protein